MVDMLREDPDEGAGVESLPVPNGGYSYGLCLHFDKDELDKLGITELPPIGCEVHIVAVGKVTRISQSAAERPGGTDEQTCMDVQITMMSCDVEETEQGAGKETPAEEMKETRTLLGSY
jgi:hypothetical protein